MTMVDTLLKALDYEFKDRSLLQRALTHRSHSAQHNERLEFLGDSVLNFVVASLLYEQFPDMDEGDLSRLRAHLVKQSALADIAVRLDLARHLLLGEGELKSGGFRRPSILSNTVEAIVGAVYLDGGFPAARHVVQRQYAELLATVDPASLGKDPKTLLQELLQAHRLELPVYTVVDTRGVAHDQLFDVQCHIAALDITVQASGSSRRGAEQGAAGQAIKAVQKALQSSGRAGAKGSGRGVRPRRNGQLSLPVAVSQENK